MEIKEVARCIGDPEKLRIIGKIRPFEEELLPLLARVLKGGFVRDYVTFRTGQSMITVYPDGHVGMTMVDDIEQAMSILKELEEKIEFVRANRDRIRAKTTPMKVNVLEIYELLPKLNCGKCGEKKRAWPSL